MHMLLLMGSWDLVTASWHITFKELKVAELALDTLGPILASKSIALFLDSATMVLVLKCWYNKSVMLRELLQLIVRLLGHYRLQLQPLFITG